MKRKVTILGATGSIGQNAIDIILDHPDQFEVVGLVGGSQAEELARLATLTNAKFVALYNDTHLDQLKNLCPSDCTVLGRMDGIRTILQVPVDVCLSAITGSAAILPTFEAIPHCKHLALANKESIVAAGEQILQRAADCGTKILPVDSEHNALFQLLFEPHRPHLSHVTITASGGAFRTLPMDQFQSITREQALSHPNWVMGPKVTVDSATLMNKGLEVIEAALLFNLPPEQVQVVIQPQSIIHAMVTYQDGSTLAQLGNPDMRTAISYALAWPERVSTKVKPLSLIDLKQLTFEEPDLVRFPCLRLAREALVAGQPARIVLNAANEAAFELFMAGKLPFASIPTFVEKALSRMPNVSLGSIEDVMDLDREVRLLAAA